MPEDSSERGKILEKAEEEASLTFGEYTKSFSEFQIGQIVHLNHFPTREDLEPFLSMNTEFIVFETLDKKVFAVKGGEGSMKEVGETIYSIIGSMNPKVIVHNHPPYDFPESPKKALFLQHIPSIHDLANTYSPETKSYIYTQSGRVSYVPRKEMQILRRNEDGHVNIIIAALEEGRAKGLTEVFELVNYVGEYFGKHFGAEFHFEPWKAIQEA